MYSIGLYIYQVDMYTLGLVVSVRRSFDASRGGKKELKSSRDKNARHEPYWGGGRGEKRLLCDPAGSELRLDGREKRRAKIINGIFFVCFFRTTPKSLGAHEQQTHVSGTSYLELVWDHFCSIFNSTYVHTHMWCYSIARRLPRVGLTSACGSAHARNGRGCIFILIVYR